MENRNAGRTIDVARVLFLEYYILLNQSPYQYYHIAIFNLFNTHITTDFIFILDGSEKRINGGKRLISTVFEFGKLVYIFMPIFNRSCNEN